MISCYKISRLFSLENIYCDEIRQESCRQRFGRAWKCIRKYLQFFTEKRGCYFSKFWLFGRQTLRLFSQIHCSRPFFVDWRKFIRHPKNPVIPLSDLWFFRIQGKAYGSYIYLSMRFLLATRYSFCIWSSEFEIILGGAKLFKKSSLAATFLRRNV